MAGVWSLLPERLWVRRLLQVAIIVGLSLLLLLGIARVMVRTPIVHNWVETRVEALSISGQSIELEGLSGDLLGAFSAEQIRVRDVEGSWLEARDIEFDWSPLYLLGGGLRVKAFNLEELSVSRRPQLPPGDAAADDGGGSWISDYRVQAFGVDDLNVEGAVLGQPVNGVLGGAIETDIATGALRISLIPDEANDDRIEGRLSWGGAVPFSGQIEASGPEDGLIANLLGARQPGRIDIRLDADGGLDDWTANGALSLGDVAYVTLNAERTRDDMLADLVADLSAFAALAPVEERLGDELVTRLSTSGSDLAVLTVSGTTVQLEARAPMDMRTLRPDLTQIDLRVDSRSPDLIGVEGLTYEKLSLQGELAVANALIQFEGYAESEALSLAGSEEAIGSYVGPAPRLDLDASYLMDSGRVTIEAAQLGVQAGIATLAGQSDLLGSTFELAGLISPAVEAGLVPAGIGLSPQDWTARRDQGGAIEVQTSGDLDLGLGSETPWLSGPLVVRSDLAVDPTGDLEVRQIEVQGDTLRAQATGRLASGNLNAEIDLTAGPASTGPLEVGGLDLRATVSGALDNLGFDVLAEPRDLVVEIYQLEQPVLRFSGRREGTELTGRVSAEAMLDEETFALQADIAQQADLWEVSNLAADLFGLALSGEASGEGADLPALSANLEVQGRSILLPQVGALNGTVQLTGAVARADVRAEDVSLGTVTLDLAEITADGSRDEVSGAVSLAGMARVGDRSVPIQAQSDYNLLTADRLLELTLEGVIDTVPVQSIEPIVLQQTDEAISVSGALEAFGGAFVVDASQSSDEVRSDLRVEDIAVADLAALIGRETLRGRMNGAVRVRGIGERLDGTAEFSFTELTQEGSEFSATSVVMRADLADQVLRVATEVGSLENEIGLAATAELPVLARMAPFQLAAASDAPLRVEMDGAGQVEALWSLFGPADIRFEGLFDVAASVSGPLDQLSPSGDVRLSNAVFEDGLVGLRLKDIDLDATVTPDGVRVNAVTASGARSGSLTGAGVYAFDGDGDVDLTLERLNALQRSDVTATVSGVLSVRRENQAAQVTGDLRFDRAEINLDRLPSSGFTTLDIRWPERGEEDVTEQPQLPIFFDVGLQADRRIFVTGQSISTEWGIGAQVTGSARAPSLSGSARIVRGEVDVVGQAFRFVDSFVRFNGPPMDAILSMRAEQEADDLLAYFAVTGTIAEPEFNLGSEPELPEDEILSRVLFGVSPSQLSGFQAAQLAAAVARLSGGGGPDVMGSLEDALDVDRLDFGVAEDGATSVGAGKYVAEDVYVEVQTGTRGDPGLGIEWTPRRNVEIGAELGSEAAPRFTIQWKRDFDFERDEDEATGPEEAAEN